MNTFALTSLAVAICCFALSVFVFIISKARLHRIWAFFNLACALWAIGTFFAAISKTPFQAEMSWRWAYGLGSIVPCAFYYFIYSYCELDKKNVLRLFFIIGIIFIPLNLLLPAFIDKIDLKFNSIYYNNATTHLSVFLIYLSSAVLLSFKELLGYYKKCDGNKKTQALYFLIGFFVGWSGGYATFLPSYGILIYPSWNIVVCAYTLLMTFAIFKHNLMDIRIVVEKSIIYAVLFAVISLIYAISIFTLEKFTQEAYGYSSFVVSIGMAFVLGLLFIPLRFKIQCFMDKYFFKGTPNEISRQNTLLRQEVAQSEKNKAVANLASGIAHEIKNPLTTLKTFFEFYPEKKDDPEFNRQFTKLAGRELDRMEGLVRQLLDFAKPSPSQFQPTDIEALIDDTLALIENKLKENKITLNRTGGSRTAPSTVRSRATPSTGRTCAAPTLLNLDPNKIKQALLNIFLNAIEAMPNGGKLTVETGVKGIEDFRMKGQNPLNPNILKPSNPFFEISITDTGSGISSKDLKHVFDPFYSKKENGTGLGLAITKSIIEEHGGIIKVSKNNNIGTVLLIEFRK